MNTLPHPGARRALSWSGASLCLLWAAACAEAPAEEAPRRSIFRPLLEAPPGETATRTTTEAPEPARLRRRQLSHDGDRLFSVELGPQDAPALLFVHGWASDHAVFRECMAQLSADTRCLALDLPGHGQSRAGETLSMGRLAESLDAVLEAAEVEKAVLVGHGDGASVALEFARRHPEHVSGLVSLDGPLRPTLTDEKIRQAMSARYRGADYRTQMRTTFDQLLSEDLPPSRREELLATAQDTPAATAVAFMDATHDPEQWGEGGIDVPLLAVHSPSSTWRGDHEQHLRSLAQDLRYYLLEDAEAFFVVQDAERFLALLRAWRLEFGL